MTPVSAMRRIFQRLDSGLSENSLFPTIAMMYGFFGLVHIVIGAFAIFEPSLYESGAYEWVRNFAPIRVWGVAMIATGSLLTFAAWKGRSLAARAGLLAYTVIQWMFGVSIFVLTLEGSTGAIAGTFQWMTGPIVALVILSRPVKPSPAEVKVANAIDEVVDEVA